MVPQRSTLRTAYVEQLALTPVAQPKDRARFRFKRLYLALAPWTHPNGIYPQGLIIRVGDSSEARDDLTPLDSLEKSSRILKNKNIKRKEQRFLPALSLK